MSGEGGAVNVGAAVRCFGRRDRRPHRAGLDHRDVWLPLLQRSLKGGANHVRDTLLKQLDEGFVDVPMGPGQPNARFTMKELGIEFPDPGRQSPAHPV